MLFFGPMLDSADVTPLDGRVARSHRTRAAIVEALVTLLEEGNPQPTVEEIATRASVAPRTVFQHYADREALFAAVSAHREAYLQDLMGTIDPDAPLADRIDQIVAQRCRVFEWIAAVRRGALLMEPFSESVHEALDGFRTAKRLELTRVFAAEIAARPERERATLAAALGAAGSWSMWDALRAHQGLDVEAASATLALTLRALLGER
jgi:AcrR family transcriptional regulator